MLKENLQLPYLAIPDILKSKVRDPLWLVRNVSGPKNATWLNTVTLGFSSLHMGRQVLIPYTWFKSLLTSTVPWERNES